MRYPKNREHAPCKATREEWAHQPLTCSKQRQMRPEFIGPAMLVSILVFNSGLAEAQNPSPALFDPNLAVRTVVTGLTQPTAIAFLAPNDFLVTEKASGMVKRVVNGVVTTTVLDLPVNSASERGLLGLALHPRFKQNHFVYLYWTESSTGADSAVLAEVGNPNSPFGPGTPQPLGNRVDRFIWDSATESLTFDRNLIRLHAFQIGRAHV